MTTLYVTDTQTINKVNRLGVGIQVITDSDEGPVIDDNRTDPNWSAWWQRYTALGGPALTPSPRETVRLDLHARARNALTANSTFLNLASPTNAQTLAQVQRLTRECSALIRLLIGSDLLVESTDT